jgi:hypothetical protein
MVSDRFESTTVQRLWAHPEFNGFTMELFEMKNEECSDQSDQRKVWLKSLAKYVKPGRLQILPTAS